MKLKYQFSVREIAGDHILVPMGDGALKLSGMIASNDVGAFLCEKLQNDTTEQALVEALVEEFEVDAETAGRDVRAFLADLGKLDLLI